MKSSLPDPASDPWVARDRYSGPVNCTSARNPGAGVPDPGHPVELVGYNEGIALGFNIDTKRFPFSTIQNRSHLFRAEVFFESPACSQGVALGWIVSPFQGENSDLNIARRNTKGGRCPSYETWRDLTSKHSSKNSKCERAITGQAYVDLARSSPR